MSNKQLQLEGLKFSLVFSYNCPLSVLVVDVVVVGGGGSGCCSVLIIFVLSVVPFVYLICLYEDPLFISPLFAYIPR